MKKFESLNQQFGSNIGQRRTYVVPIHGNNYEYRLECKPGQKGFLSIPDAGGQADLVPKYHEQFEWLVEEINGLDGIKQVWGTVWEVDTSAVETIDELFRGKGYIKSVSLQAFDFESMKQVITICSQGGFIGLKNKRQYCLLLFNSLPGFGDESPREIRLTIDRVTADEFLKVGCTVREERNGETTFCPWFKRLIGLIEEQKDVSAVPLKQDYEYRVDIGCFDMILEELFAVDPGCFDECYVSLHFEK